MREMIEPIKGLATQASREESQEVRIKIGYLLECNVELFQMFPRISFSLVFVKFRHFEVLEKRDHGHGIVKRIRKYLLKSVIFNVTSYLKPFKGILYFLDILGQNACERRCLIFGCERLRRLYALVLVTR
jgi:hypothetical protein